MNKKISIFLSVLLVLAGCMKPEERPDNGFEVKPEKRQRPFHRLPG